jgi:nucleotide-binding universal stress UspA family protein
MKTQKAEKVLIALDYDQTAQKVAETGFSLAKTMKAEVILLHVMTDPFYYSSIGYSPIMGFTGYLDGGQLQLESVDALKVATSQYLDNVKKHLGDDTIKTMIKEGDFAESILEIAKKVHADIIVMGSHSRKWLEKIIMGSVTEKVLQLTTVPLFIVPTKKQD